MPTCYVFLYSYSSKTCPQQWGEDIGETDGAELWMTCLLALRPSERRLYHSLCPGVLPALREKVPTWCTCTLVCKKFLEPSPWFRLWRCLHTLDSSLRTRLGKLGATFYLGGGDPRGSSGVSLFKQHLDPCFPRPSGNPGLHNMLPGQPDLKHHGGRVPEVNTFTIFTLSCFISSLSWYTQLGEFE